MDCRLRREQEEEVTPTRYAVLALLALVGVSAPITAQRLAAGDSVKAFVTVDAPIVALTHVRVIDGTGAAARPNQTLVIQDGSVVDLGDTGRVSVPSDAITLDLSGKSVMPGIVMVHEHLFYPTGPGVYGQLGESFTRLYLAGGVTTMRTGGNLNGYMDLNLKRLIDRGEKPGPAIDATAPYVNGPNTFVQMQAVNSTDEARKHVAYWSEAGATSLKAYMQISRAALGAAIDEAHRRKMKVTGHLCSVTYGEAADLGIDDLEHGFFAATDFVANKKPDECPSVNERQQSFADLDETSESFKALVKKLVDKRVAVTSTLTVFEVSVPGRPMPPGLEVLTPQLRQRFEQAYARAAKNTASPGTKLFPKMMTLERAFVRAGGLLVAGTDPTGPGGVIPGFANQRQIELLVEAGFSPLEAISIATLNGARYLGRDARIGSIAKGKQADLVVLNGDPSTSIADVRNVDTVFRQGVAFSPATLVDSVRGYVGLW
jgi:imidazolonepropionase-like amidohydrolase